MSQFSRCGKYKPNLVLKWYFWKWFLERQTWQTPSLCYRLVLIYLAVCGFSKLRDKSLWSSSSGLASVLTSAEIFMGALCKLPGIRLTQWGRNAISECWQFSYTTFAGNGNRQPRVGRPCKRWRGSHALSCTGAGAAQHGSSFFPSTGQQAVLKSVKACIAFKEKGFPIPALLKPEVQGIPGDSQAALKRRRVLRS